MLEVKDFVTLAKAAAKAKRSAPVAYSYNGENFNYDQVQEAVREQFKELAPDFYSYRENKNTIFRIIEETLSEIVPERIKENYMQFAEVKRFAQGDKPIFRRKTMANNRNRGKQFVTRVGLAGIYEVWKLGSAQESFEIPTSAIGGAVQIGFEEMIDGRVDWAELINILYEGIDDLIYQEVGEAFAEGIYQLPANHVHTGVGFIEADFDKLLNQAKMYGNVTIYCTNEFAVKMIPQEAWRYTESMKDELYRTGKLTGYKGENVVILPNQYKDAYGTEKVLDPSLCWIIPTGADQKPVKIAFEGDLYTNEFENYDWSKDIHVYEKVGVVCLMDNASHVYQDTSLKKDGPFNLKDTVTNSINIGNTVITTNNSDVEVVAYEKVATADIDDSGNKTYYTKNNNGEFVEVTGTIDTSGQTTYYIKL